MKRRVPHPIFLVAMTLLTALACEDAATTPGSDGDTDTGEVTDQESLDGDTNADSPTDSTEGTGPGPVHLTVQDTTVLHDITSTRDQNYQQLGSNTRGHMQHNACGTLGLLYRKTDLDRKAAAFSLVLYENGASGTTSQTVYTADYEYQLGGFNWSLVYDAQCRPSVIRLNEKQYFRHTRDGDAWQQETLDLGLEAALGKSVTGVNHLAALADKDGVTHLLMGVTTSDGVSRVVHAVEGQDGFTLTMAEEMDSDIWEVFSFAIDDNGGIHSAYKKDRHLYYARLEGGTWTREPVILRANFDTEAAWNASLALTPTGEPVIASTYIQRVETGSFSYAELRYNTRAKGGAWHSQTILTKSDGYAGGDGVKYTGDDPCLVFDGQGRAHLAFNDMASWHAENGNDYLSGQVRYGYNGGDGWQFFTVVAQQGQSQSPNPLHDFIHPTLAVSWDGDTLYFAGVERVIEGPTLAFDPGVTVQRRLTLVTANLAPAATAR